MFFAIIYCVTGVVVFALSLSKKFGRLQEDSERHRRFGMRILAGSLCLLGLYNGYRAFYFNTEEGRRLDRTQKELQKRKLQQRSYR